MMRSKVPPAILGALALLGMFATVVWAQGVPAPVSNATVTVNGTSSVTSDGGFGVVVNGSVAVTQPLTVTSDGGLGVRVNGSVTVAQPVVVESDGGMGVIIRGPLQTISDGGVAVGVFAPDVIRVVGPDLGAVIISGTVTSNPSASFSALLNPTCTYSDFPPAPTLTTTAADVDDATITNRTEMTIVNLSNIHDVWCCKSAACTPTATAAYIIQPQSSFRFEGLRDSVTIRCKSSTATSQINVLEVSCG